MHEESRDAMRAEKEAIAASPLTTGSADAISLADDFLEGTRDREQRNDLRVGESRIDFAVVASNIARDRYSAGSTAARATIYILLTHGFQAAKDFADDLDHHEDF